MLTCGCQLTTPSKDEINYTVLKKQIDALTTQLEQLQNKPVNSYSMDKVYGQNDWISYQGNIYISLKDENTDVPEDNRSWQMIDLTKRVTTVKNNVPIGTILQVPSNLTPEGYVPLESGKTFDRNLYPKLYEALGSDVFPYSTSNTTDSSELPIGSLIYSLVNDEMDIPHGWTLWETKRGNLDGSPLLQQFTKIMMGVPNEQRSLWEQAILDRTFPKFPSDFFLKVIQSGSLNHIGQFTQDTVKDIFNFRMVMPPIVPMQHFGVENGTCDVHGSSTALSTCGMVASTTCPSNVIYGDTTSKYKAVTGSTSVPPASMFEASVDVNSLGYETQPKNVGVKVLVKTHYGDTHSGSTFKLVIKAYDFLQDNAKNVVLDLEDFLTKSRSLYASLLDIQHKFEMYKRDKDTELAQKATDITTQITTAIDTKLNEKVTAIGAETKQAIATQQAELNKQLEATKNDLATKTAEINTQVEAVKSKVISLDSISKAWLAHEPSPVDCHDNLPGKYIGKGHFLLSTPDEFLVLTVGSRKLIVPAYEMKSNWNKETK